MPLRDGGKGGLFVSVKLVDGTVLGDPTRTSGARVNYPRLSSSAKKAPPHCAAGQVSRRTIMSTALDQAVSFGVSASRRRVSPELRAAFVV